MPTRLAAPVFTVDAGKMHKIDTSNVENLYSMWTVFNKCAESMEEGRRLENLSWRLWNRETLCCGSKPQFANSAIDFTSFARQTNSAPSLSSSVESAASEDYEYSQSQTRSPPVQIKPLSSGKSSIESLSASGRLKAKHISSQELEKMVISIKETKINRKLDMTSLPPYINDAFPSAATTPYTSSPSSTTSVERGETTPVPKNTTSPKHISDPRASHSTTSTVLMSSSGSEAASSNTSASEISNNACASPGVVRGFTPSSISVHRTSSHLASSPAPMPMKSCLRTKPENLGPKGGNFMLGGSSEEDEPSSLEDRMSVQNSKSPNLQLPMRNAKVTSFVDEVKSRREANRSHDDEDPFEETSEEDDDDVSESDADENDDDDDDWEDSASESGAASPVEKTPMFQRVDSKPNLVSRRSLLTTMMHQGDRANAMAGMAAAKSQPNLQRSRTSTPNGPSVATSPEDESFLEMQRAGITRSKPMLMAPANNYAQSALSPRTTRRNMLSTELTESLRKHLLWERQQKNTTVNAVNKLKRRHTAHDNMMNLREYPGQVGSGTGSKNNSWNYFDHGLGEYHQKGW